MTFAPAARNDLAAFADFKDELEALLGRPVDLVERAAVEASRNYIRRRRILAEAEAVYGAPPSSCRVPRAMLDLF